MSNILNFYFAGASHRLALYWQLSLNCNKLFSQELNRREIEYTIEQKKLGKFTGKILIDSGAFSAHTQGIELDVDEYIEYINSITEWIDYYAQVDKIPGIFGMLKTEQQLLSAPRESWINYLYMRPRMKEPEKLMPIYHQGEDIKWLWNMLEWTDEKGNHIPYIGISPANDKHQSEKDVFVEECFNVIKKSSNPNVLTHAYGMTNTATLERHPFTSADSTSWALCAVNGSIMTHWGVIPLSEQNKNSKAFRGQSQLSQKLLREYIEANDFDLDDLIEAPNSVAAQRIKDKGVSLSIEEIMNILEHKSSSIHYSKLIKPEIDIVKYENGRSISGRLDNKAYLERIHWNICYMKKWSDNRQYKPVSMTRKQLIQSKKENYGVITVDEAELVAYNNTIKAISSKGAIIKAKQAQTVTEKPEVDKADKPTVKDEKVITITEFDPKAVLESWSDW